MQSCAFPAYPINSMDKLQYGRAHRYPPARLDRGADRGARATRLPSFRAARERPVRALRIRRGAGDRAGGTECPSIGRVRDARRIYRQLWRDEHVVAWPASTTTTPRPEVRFRRVRHPPGAPCRRRGGRHATRVLPASGGWAPTRCARTACLPATRSRMPRSCTRSSRSAAHAGTSRRRPVSTS
jgi:hypothetical protein